MAESRAQRDELLQRGVSVSTAQRQSFTHTHVPLPHLPSRRSLLQVGGLGLLGLGAVSLAAARVATFAAEPAPAIKPKAKRVIFLFQWGGPSHLDMFDMKPDAPDGIRGPYKPIQSSVPGVVVGEKLPEVAKRMHHVAQVRSVFHSMKNHNSAGYYALTGHAPPSDDQRLRDSLDLYPAYGSVVDRLAPGDREMPAFVSYPHVISDGSITPGQHASFLGKGHDPLLILQDPNSASFALPELSLPAGMSLERLQARRKVQQLVDSQLRQLESLPQVRGLDSYFERALGMLASDRVRKAFDLSAEPESVRDRYGRTTYGQGCLLARRLAEAGSKWTTVYFSDTIGGQKTDSGGWDTHGFNNTHMFPIVEKYHFPMTEQTLPALLDDLHERGMLADTLVVWMGEFGRTPKINAQTSRDHWPDCYTVLFAGGGVKGGYVYGKSDSRGMYPDEKPVRPDDIAATIYHLMGIDPAAEIRDTAGRPLPITRGKPILDLIT